MNKFIYFIISFLSLLYLISPVDIIPDIIPVFGYLDDIGVLMLVIYYIYKSMKELKGSSENNQNEENKEVINGNYVIIEEDNQSPNNSLPSP